MCGIAGSLISPHVDIDPVKSLNAIIEQLHHRGPDYQQVINLGAAQLGHARLSIIDTRQHANQPMTSEDGNFSLTFNGEIYNYLELRQELITLGHQFRTHSDTEVLLQSWQAWGPACLEKLIGMFAFAIWNQSTQTLYLARDRMGEKPLYYTDQDGIIFASELNALLKHPLVSTDINAQAINQFLSLNYILTNQCIIKNVKKLPPAHYLIFQANKKSRVKPYWDLSHYFTRPKTTLSFNDSLEQFQSLYDEVVSMQLRSDVKLGAYLSGGLDSSSIVASMLTSTPANNINTFSIDFRHQSYSELKYSQQVAEFLQVDHKTKHVDIDQPHQIFTALDAYDEPFADTSLIPCYYLAQFSRQFVTVALSGDGGDELFAGYETYLADRYHRRLRFLPPSIKKMAFQLINRHMRSSFNKVSLDYKLKQFLAGLNYDHERAHYSWREIFSPAEKQQLCSAELQQQFTSDPFDEYRQHYDAVKEAHWLDQSSYVDMKTWLVDDILTKIDRSSMAHSLELRCPFLDHRMVEFSAQLPTNWKLKSQEKKYYLKRSQQNRLPKKIIYRKKRGFNAPIAHWLLNKQMIKPVESLLLNQSMTTLFNADVIKKLIFDHQHKTKDNSLKLFGLMSLSQWLRRNNAFSNNTSL